jgi:uncharacterized cofD-like protein
MRLKRWLLLAVLGVVLCSAAATVALQQWARLGVLPEPFATLTLASIPAGARAGLLGGLGVLLSVVGLGGLYRSLAEVVEPAVGGNGHSTLLDVIYRARMQQGGPRVVCIGGGTGMPAVLRGLKTHTSHITAVVTVGDDGGSSGRLRREHGILPPGDFRNNIVALAEVEPLMGRLFQYRFGAGSSLEGHSFGNLFVLAMTGVTGSFEFAIRETSRVLAVRGTILPSTLEDVRICARFTDGTEVEGESLVPEQGKAIDRVYMEPEHPAAQPDAVKAILDADLIVLGPGSLYTSVIPNLLVEGIAKALQQSRALKVYVANVATQPGETDGYSVEDHVAALARHMPGGKNPVDVVLAARHDGDVPPGDPNVTLVKSRGQREPGGPIVALFDVARTDQPLRHDPEKLGLALMRVLAGYGRSTRRPY